MTAIRKISLQYAYIQQYTIETTEIRRSNDRFGFKKASLWMLLLVVLAYQSVGTLGEWAMKGDLFAALQDFRLGVPGMMMQVAGGWLFINHLIRK